MVALLLLISAFLVFIAAVVVAVVDAVSFLLPIMASVLYWPLLLASLVVSFNAMSKSAGTVLAAWTMGISFICLFPATLLLGLFMLRVLPFMVR